MTQLVRVLAALFLSLWVSVPRAAEANFALDDPLVSVFGGLREEVSGMISDAEGTGNRLLEQVARSAFKLIEASETAAGNLVDKTFSSLDKSVRDSFNEIDELVTRVEAGQEVLIEDAMLLSATWFGAMSNLPFVDQNFDVYGHRPRTISPTGSERVKLTVVGPGLGVAEPTARINQTDLAVEIPNRNTVDVILERSKFGFTDQPDQVQTVVLSFNEKEATLFRRNPQRIERELSLWILPRHVARWNLIQSVIDAKTERKPFQTTVSASARDTLVGPYAQLRADDLEEEWEIDKQRLGEMVDFIRGGGQNLLFGLVSGDSAACVGPNMQRLEDDRVEFLMQMGSVKGKNAYGTCWIDLPLIRTVDVEVEFSSYGFPVLTWGSDERLDFLDGLQTWTLELDLFDGRQKIVTDGSDVPAMDVQVEKGDDHIVLRAIEPKDF